MLWLAIDTAIRLAVFGLAFVFAAQHSANISIRPRSGLHLVAMVFAALNLGICWFADPEGNLAALGVVWFIVPLIINGCFLYVTERIMAALRIDMKLGILATVWLAFVLTATHGVLYLVLDVLL